MRAQIKHFYEFGPFRLDVGERILMCEDRVVPLTPKAFETLLALVENSGRIVEKDFLMKKIWPDTFVEEVSLARNVSALRKALGEIDGGNQYIETFPRRGYRFVAAVSEHRDDSSVALVEDPPASDERQAVSLSALPVAVSETDEAHATLKVPASPDSPAVKKNLGSYIKRHKSAAITAIAALVIGVAATTYILRFDNASDSPPSEMKITRLTNTGRATNGTISPDGKYVAYVISETKKFSLWIKHIATDSEVQIVPQTEESFLGLTFSRDGNYVYYVKTENGQGALYQSPILGGASKKLIEDIGSPITFSPDENRFAFIRFKRESTFIKEGSLIIANADGTGEQTLAIRTHPDFFTDALAWSPSNKTIACSVSSLTGGHHAGIVEVRLEDGTEKLLTSRKWVDIGRIAWLADGSHLVMNGRDQSSSPKQIWLLSYPDGKERRVTNDLADYTGVSLAADSRTLVTRQFNLFLNVWTAPDADSNRAVQLTSGEGAAEHLSWTPDGKIVYSTHNSGSQSIWIMEANGAGKKRLTGDSFINGRPTVSPDGRFIVFSSDRDGPTGLWRMDIDGGNVKKLTGGNQDAFPDLSLDGRWLIYVSDSSSSQLLKKMSIDGGEVTQLNYEIPNPTPQSLVVSPDGKQAACFFKETPSSLASGIAILPIEGGKPLKTFAVPPTRTGIALRWMPDGQSLAYINTTGGVSNIWTQPLDGGEPKQLTNFNSERIFYFDWSRDGKQFGCVRGYSTSDIVLISNFR